MLVDSHCHLDRLDLSKYNGDLKKALDFALENGVSHMLCVCINMENFPIVLTIAKSYNNVSCSVGVHPSEIGEEPSVEKLVELAKDKKVVAFGETGLDYFYKPFDAVLQKKLFLKHVYAAKIVKKPLIIHSRQASQDILDILKAEKLDEIGGVMHCFSENYDIAKKVIELNFHIGISGIVTFPKALELKNVAKLIPIDRMLIETDAPYLAPVPKRGKSNEPAYVRYTAECIANLRHISFEELASKTTENFYKLFGL